MAWCPKCKSEYVEGIKTCADCKCDLVDSLEETRKMTAWEEEIALRALKLQQEELQKELQKEQSQLNIEFPDEMEIDLPESVDEEIIGDALEQMMDSEEFAFDEEEERPKHVMPYINNEEKALEHKASAHSLTVIGFIGLVAIILLFFDVLPIHLPTMNKILICGVMGALFGLFFVMGLVSAQKYKILAKKAKKENNLTKEIKNWCMASFSPERIDAGADLENEPDELKYFRRFDKMKELIQNQFMYLDEGYLDRLIDEIYPDIFGEE